MFISINSLKNFFLVNSFLLSLGFFQYEFIEIFTKNKLTDFFIYFFIFIIRNYSLLFFIEFSTDKKPKISNEFKFLF